MLHELEHYDSQHTVQSLQKLQFKTIILENPPFFILKCDLLITWPQRDARHLILENYCLCSFQKGEVKADIYLQIHGMVKTSNW